MSEKFEAFGLVELMGHQRVAGRLTEQVVGGANMLRVDIPDSTDPEKFRTVYYGASAIYAVHITDEAAARKLAGNLGTRPPYAYELSQAVARIAPSATVHDDKYEDEQHDPEGEEF
jgi:hypothetical protein